MSLELSLRGATVIIGGHTVTGWADESDALSLPAIESAQITRGADGQLMAMSTGNQGGEVMVKLLATSVSARYFSQRFTEQVQGARFVWEGSIRYADNTVISLSRGVLKTAPSGITMGTGEVATQEFVFEFEQILMNRDIADVSSAPSIPAA